ncbi:MAG: hypothetical protein HOH55_04635 [Candidatus Marinimicrobia bacterium]|nr:hypothetical protein [Candidatus Neomarinimicrobiota bacterium]
MKTSPLVWAFGAFVNSLVIGCPNWAHPQYSLEYWGIGTTTYSEFSLGWALIGRRFENSY